MRSAFIKYAAINFAFYITVTFNSYVNVFLQSIGFDAQRVGIMSALISAVGIFASPFWGAMSDKFRSLKKMIVLAMGLGAVLFIAVPMMSGVYIGAVSVLFIAIPATMFFRQPVMPLVDNWTIRNANAAGLNYGALRAFGALSFALAAFALGYIVPRIEVAYIFYIGAAMAAPGLVLIILVKGSADDDGTKRKALTFKEMQFGLLFKNYYLITYIIFNIFQRVPFISSMTFLPFLIEAVGGDMAQLGIIMGLRAAVEIPVMFLLKPLQKRFPLYILISVAIGLYAVEFVLYGFVTDFLSLVLVSVLHGLGNGLLIPAGATYIFSLAPDNLKATSQTALASVSAVAGILGGLIGGWLIASVGVHRFYFIIGIFSAVFLGLFLLSFVVGEKVLGLKRPGLAE